jgi:hypothetical protein
MSSIKQEMIEKFRRDVLPMYQSIVIQQELEREKKREKARRIKQIRDAAIKNALKKIKPQY